MRKRAFTLVDFALGVTVAGVVAAILFPLFFRTPSGDHPTSAYARNSKPVAGAGGQYRQDINKHVKEVP